MVGDHSGNYSNANMNVEGTDEFCAACTNDTNYWIRELTTFIVPLTIITYVVF